MIRRRTIPPGTCKLVLSLREVKKSSPEIQTWLPHLRKSHVGIHAFKLNFVAFFHLRK